MTYPAPNKALQQTLTAFALLTARTLGDGEPAFGVQVTELATGHGRDILGPHLCYHNSQQH